MYKKDTEAGGEVIILQPGVGRDRFGYSAEKLGSKPEKGKSAKRMDMTTTYH